MRPSTARGEAARRRLAEAALDHLVEEGDPGQSLRAFAAAVGVSHSLLIYHFGSTTGLLAEVHRAGEERQRAHLAALRTRSSNPLSVMSAMWKHLAEPEMWPLYRVGFALRLRDDVPTPDEREAWAEVLVPLLRDLGLTGAKARDEAMLWIGTCRGLLWELVTGADVTAVHRAAHRFFAHYRPAAR